MQNYGQRISVVGTTGSGKTTVARQISSRLKLPYIELDALYWDKNWTGVSDPIFRERVISATETEHWVIDGNYSRIRSLVWERADTVVYLDYSFWRTFWQLFKRTIKRSIQQEDLWHGNREDLHRSFFSSDSIMLWMLKSYKRRRNQYATLMQQPEYVHMCFVQLKSPKMTKAWLSSLTSITN
jgi:adenylate kinase family enzyme